MDVKNFSLMNLAIRPRRLTILFVACTLSVPSFALAQAPPPLQYGRQGNGFSNTNLPNAGQYNAPQANSTFQSNAQQPSARLAALPQYNNGSQPGDPVALPPAEGTEGTTAGEGTAEAASSIQVGNIISIIREGGVSMIPIIFCSIVLLVFVFERMLFLRRARVIPKPFVRGVIEQLEQQQLEKDDAIELCQENGSPIADLFISALKKWGRPAVEIEQAILDAGERVTSQLRKYLRLFNAISNLAPLLGLLGTVLGMIDSFNTIAEANAMGRPELLASGIGAALLTTAAGLCVAIPAYTAYAFFVGRTDKLILEMDVLAQDLVDTISAEALQANSGRSRSRSRKAA